MEKTEYKGWKNCYRLANKQIELIVTGDVGPRIIRLGFVGGENEFKEYKDQVGKTGGNEWRIYGGHRFWHAPEEKPRTYFPDNVPVEVKEQSGFVRVIQPTETTTGIQKEIDLALDPREAYVKVTHRLRNHNLWAVELAPWALSVMDVGGKIIIPLPPRGSHEQNLLPVNLMTLWAYTDLSDPRWTWCPKYIMLSQDPQAATPQKAGLMVPDGWVAHFRKGNLFVKKFTYQRGACYPDWGCSVETYTNADMLEAETVGPTVKLLPGATLEHVEHWSLFRGLSEPMNDADLDANVLPKVKAAKG
jgi:hypothetical protein